MTGDRPILWTAAEVGQVLDTSSTAEWDATGVSIDSRTVEPGDLFVALSGPTHDGNDFVEDALGKGAVAAIASRPSSDPRVLIVEDTMAALETLALAARERSAARIVAVTGSVGKTGTKEALALALSRLGSVHKTVGNLNNHIGLPLTLARMPRDVAYGVFEMGMNHAGELDGLSRMARPDVAVITTVEAVHLEYFSGVEAICDAKCEIFAGVSGRGAAVLNRDHPLFARMAAAAKQSGVNRLYTFGRDQDATVSLVETSLHAACSAVTARTDDQVIDYCLGAPGEHWVMNSLAVLATVRALNADVTQAVAALSDVRAPRGRGELRTINVNGGGAIKLIDESYNASPASVRAAVGVLSNANPVEDGRRVLVLGDMLELGADSATLHAALAPVIEATRIDRVHCCGPMMAALHAVLPPALRGAHMGDSAALAPIVAADLRDGDIVTVKGSLGSRMAAIVAAIEGLAAADEPAANEPAANEPATARAFANGG